MRKLDRFTLEPDGDLWTDYDVGGSAYGDYTLDGGTPTEQTRYVPGLGQQAVGSAVDYLFGDQIGTLRMTRSAGTPQVTTKRVYTAFGELVEMTGTGQTRYGYAGAWGYQEHDADGANGPDNSVWDGDGCACGARIGEVLPFLHVGARYYDPSTGRFLQRDPIGIDGGLNTYSYVGSSPLDDADPDGMMGLLGPDCPLFGRGRLRVGGPGIFNRGNVRLGWSWFKDVGKNLFALHGGRPGTPGHWHLYLNRFWPSGPGQAPLWARFAVRGCQALAIAGAAKAGWEAGQLADEYVPKIWGGDDTLSGYVGSGLAWACPTCWDWVWW